MHREYIENLPLWKQVRLSVKGQHAIRAEGETYLAKTSGMKKNPMGEEIYQAYKGRARFYEITSNAQSGIIGLSYKTLPTIEGDDLERKVTNSGRDILSLSNSTLRSVLETARHVLVCDAKDGIPYIAEYTAESLIDWVVNPENPSELIRAKFKEQRFDADDVYHESPKEVTREYVLDGGVHVYIRDDADDLIEEYDLSGLVFLPIVVVGSIDCDPKCDPIPLLPVSDCAIAVYQISADYRQYLYGHAQGTPYGTGVNQEDRLEILAGGLGVGAFLTADNENAKFGMLQPEGGRADEFKNAIADEFSAAEAHAVRMVSNGDGVEAAESLKLRAATQHATVYTVLKSVADGISTALGYLNQMAGSSVMPEFKFNDDFTTQTAEAAMIREINSAVMAGTLPKVIMNNYVRDTGLTELSDEELADGVTDTVV